ncbi:MAG: glycosyltransferase [Candidatus Saccharimonadales bacterium]
MDIDLESVVFYLFAAASTLYVLHFGLYLTGASFYDMWQFRRQSMRKPRRHRTRPLISVLIPAHNEQKVIIRCLESIRKSSVRKVQIIVIDDGSEDATARLVRQYKKAHPHLMLTLVCRRKNRGKGEALNYALRRHARGKFVMTLDADSLLTRDAIKNACMYFADPSVAGVAANVQIIEEPTVLGILQKFEHMIGYRSKKIYSLTNCEYVVGGVASTYRMSVLRKAKFYDTDTVTEDIGLSIKVARLGNREHRIIYAADVVAKTEGVDSLRGLIRQRFRWKYGGLQGIIKHRRLIANFEPRYTLALTMYRLPMAIFGEITLLLSPFIWSYMLYITLAYQHPGFFFGSYLTITLYTFVTLWWDEHASLRHRIYMSLYAPVAYFIFYIMDVVQFLAAIRCVLRTQQLLAEKNVGGKWVSPRRIGREVLTGRI